jgi:hypothetical protein
MAHDIVRHGNFKDLTGRRFGRLTVIAFVGRDDLGHSGKWKCRCDCRNEKLILAKHLHSGATQSCGCLLREKASARRKTHGMSGTPVYDVWAGMHTRCTNSKENHWDRYGGRGIKVCERWSGPGGFENFLADMGERPSARHQIDRKENDGDYEPGNCHWVLSKVNNRNRGNNRILEFQGERLCLAEWAERLGISHVVILKRLQAGYSIERALTQPVRKMAPRKRKEVAGGPQE